MNSEKKAATPIVRHLIDDDVVTFTTKGYGEAPYRIRIWKGAEDRGDGRGLQSFAPVVLVSHIADPDCMWPSPVFLTAKVANYINTAVLHHPAAGLSYFEDEQVIARKKGPVVGQTYSDVRQLYQVRFEYFGNSPHRLQFFKPERYLRDWSDLEKLVGREVDR